MVLFLVTAAYGQCDRSHLRKRGRERLSPYLYDMVAFTEVSLQQPQPVEGSFTVYKKQKYRFVSLAQGVGKSIAFKVYDDERNLLFSNEDKPKVKHFDFKADETAEYTVQFELPPPSNQRKGVACVAFMLGYQ